MKKLITTKWFLAILTGLVIFSIFIASQIKIKGNKEFVTFKSLDLEIEGILSLPKNKGPHPAVVLLHGSGTNQTYDKWYNKFHMNALIKRGFAVLAYTKRGSGKNNVEYEQVTFDHLIQDALASVSFLREKPQIDPDRIGLLAVSESGWLTPEIGKKDGNINFIIKRVSPTIDWQETVIHEIRTAALDFGFTPKEIEDELIPYTRRVWQFFIQAAEDHQ